MMLFTPCRVVMVAWALVAGSVIGTAKDSTESAPIPPKADTGLVKQATPSAAKPECPPDAGAVDSIRVTSAYKSTRTGDVKAPETEVGLGDDLTVEVEGLKVLIQKSLCQTPHKRIVLFLDGKPLTDVSPFPPTNPERNLLVFPLRRTEASRDVWTFILGSPPWTPRKTRISVGLEGEYEVDSQVTIDFVVISHGWFIFWTLLFVGLVIGFGVLAVKSDVLRDSGSTPAGGVDKSYSLARTQAAWWFFLILAAYLFIGTITGDFSTTITGTVLVLLGISAGTMLGSAAIDASGTTSNATGLPGVVQPNVPLVPGAPAGQPGPPAGGSAAPSTGHWWRDIISDKNGVSFHRIQSAIWTLVLGIIFAIQVYKVLAMPQFSETLLALMGISAGTFLGLKLTEPK